jgi:sugar O-acyltransferase (sialic acid O-acetyltransferase NeuD family)
VSAPPELLLVGAGGLGRETAAAVRALNSLRPTYTLLGFLDDDLATDTEVDGLPVLGPATPDTLARHPDARVTVCTAGTVDRFSRRRLVTRLGLHADRSATVVHPGADLAEGCPPGPGSIVLASAVTTTATAIGAHVVVMPGVVLTHDDEVGDFVTFGAGVRLGGSVVVATGAYLGAGALVRERCRIGEWSVVGMGAVVLGDVAPGEVCVGNPARHLRTLELPEDPPA